MDALPGTRFPVARLRDFRNSISSRRAALNGNGAADAFKNLSCPEGDMRAAFSPEGIRIAIAVGKQASRPIGRQHWTAHIVFLPDGRQILIGSRDNTAKLGNAQTGREPLSLRAQREQVIGVAF